MKIETNIPPLDKKVVKDTDLMETLYMYDNPNYSGGLYEENYYKILQDEDGEIYFLGEGGAGTIWGHWTDHDSRIDGIELIHVDNMDELMLTDEDWAAIQQARISKGEQTKDVEPYTDEPVEYVPAPQEVPTAASEQSKGEEMER
jgi:hypothetical protein